ncbi:MAG: hypothetical protein ABW175_25090 [Bradyrhizobium sp.]
MALTADDIVQHPAIEPGIRRLAQALLLIHDVSPRLASLFGTRQRWLMAHAAVAQYFHAVAAAGPRAGLSMGRLLDQVERYEVASRNTAAAFLKEMLKYDIIRHVAGSEARRHRPYEPAPTTLAALFQWHLLHLAALDGLDGGTRSATLRDAPEALQRLQPLIAEGILGTNTVRTPGPTFALFAWVDEGGIVMDRLIVGCEEAAAGLDRVTTDVTSISSLAQRLKLSRSQLGRKLATAEAMGSLGWVGARGKSRIWVSDGFRREYFRAQAVKLAIIDAAFEACFMPES